MTKEEFPYWSEEETMKFLNYSNSAMRTLRNSKVLTRYKIGHRFFYDQREVAKLVEDSKVYDQDTNEYQNYIVSNTKTLSDKELNRVERKYVLNSAKYVLESITELFPEYLNDMGRNMSIVRMCLEGKPVKEIQEKYNVSATRITQILDKGLRVIVRKISVMKVNHADYISIKQENELLNRQITFLVKALSQCNEEVQPFIKDVDNSFFTPISELNISVRLYNILRSLDIDKLGDIIDYRKRDLILFRGMGTKSLNELLDVLEEYGYELPN